MEVSESASRIEIVSLHYYQTVIGSAILITIKTRVRRTQTCRNWKSTLYGGEIGKIFFIN